METKTARKKRKKADWKWAKVVFGKLDELEERMKIIEEFLGGQESMKAQISSRDKNEEREIDG